MVLGQLINRGVLIASIRVLTFAPYRHLVSGQSNTVFLALGINVRGTILQFDNRASSNVRLSILSRSFLEGRKRCYLSGKTSLVPSFVNHSVRFIVHRPKFGSNRVHTKIQQNLSKKMLYRSCTSDAALYRHQMQRFFVLT